MGDTIFAQATAVGRAGLAIIRISGPAALAAAAGIAGEVGSARFATLRWLRDPETGERLDQAVVIAFPAPGSFTGEDVVELQLHGSPAVCRSVLAALGRVEGLRPAEPGEFTRRALLNGRLDLSQVEGLGDLLGAETSAQQRQALRLMDGAVSRLAARWGTDAGAGARLRRGEHRLRRRGAAGGHARLGRRSRCATSMLRCSKN